MIKCCSFFFFFFTKPVTSWSASTPPSLPYLSPSWLCWWVDNGMQLNLLLISTLMCVIKYITKSQLTSCGAIHHFNWYPPQITWVAPVLAQWLVLRLRGGESTTFFIYFLFPRTHRLYSAHLCMCVCVLILGLIACCYSCPPHSLPKLPGTPENRNAALCYVSLDANVFCLLNGNAHWDADSIQTRTFCSDARA